LNIILYNLFLYLKMSTEVMTYSPLQEKRDIVRSNAKSNVWEGLNFKVSDVSGVKRTPYTPPTPTRKIRKPTKTKFVDIFSFDLREL